MVEENMVKPLGVGIIGASADRGWAKISHVPAVQQLAGLELVAVASGTQSKADAAAKAFGAKVGYADGKELILDPDVDIVAIAVKVPNHRELVLAAVAAGKHIYCEWPLGRNLGEAEEMMAAARASGIHAAIGLQMRRNAALLRARELLASGAIGRPLSARVLSSTMAFGSKVEAAMAFAEDAENGVTLVTIQGAHTIDFALALLGPFLDISALMTTQYPTIEVGDSTAEVMRTTPDQLFVQARFGDGNGLSLEVVGGRPPEAVQFRMEVTGEKGVLALDGGAVRGFQSGGINLTLKSVLQSVAEGETAAMTDEAASVAGIYIALRDDISFGTSTAPNFEHSVRLARLVDDLQQSAQTGRRKQAAGWP